jgi:hypothetical protein
MARSSGRARGYVTVNPGKAITTPRGIVGTPAPNPWATGTPTISGTLAAATIGQPYNSSLTVTVAGVTRTDVPVSVNGSTAGQAHSVGNGITHNGFGRFTSGSVTA